MENESVSLGLELFPLDVGITTYERNVKIATKTGSFLCKI